MGSEESRMIEKISVFFFFKQKTAYEIKECDWSSDVCSSDLPLNLNKSEHGIEYACKYN